MPVIVFTKNTKQEVKSINYIMVKVFKTGPRKACGRQPLQKLKWYGLTKLLKQTILLQIF